MARRDNDSSSEGSFGELMFSTIRKDSFDPMRSNEINMSANVLSIYQTQQGRSQHLIVKQIIEKHLDEFIQWTGKRQYEIIFQNTAKTINKRQFYQSMIGFENIMILVVLENDGLAFGCFDSHKIPSPPAKDYKYSSGLLGKMFAFSVENKKEKSFICERRAFKKKGIAVYETQNEENASIVHVKSFFGVLCNCLGELFTGFEKYYKMPDGFEVSDFTNGAKRFEIGYVAVVQWY